MSDIQRYAVTFEDIPWGEFQGMWPVGKEDGYFQDDKRYILEDDHLREMAIAMMNADERITELENQILNMKTSEKQIIAEGIREMLFSGEVQFPDDDQLIEASKIIAYADKLEKGDE